MFLLRRIDFPLTPQPLSQEERGEKPQELRYFPLSFQEGGLGGEVKYVNILSRVFLQTELLENLFTFL